MQTIKKLRKLKVIFRLTEEEMRELVEKSNQFARGNSSELIRIAIKAYQPDKLTKN
jgi:hypothetical protein